MGCSLSKELESPSKRSKEAWDSVIQKGLAVQMDRSLKSSEAGYIAAIFSANYGSLKKAGHVDAVARDELLLSKKGSFNPHKVSKAVGGDLSASNAKPQVTGTFRKSWPDLRVGLPKFGEEEAAAAGAANGSMEGKTVSEPETINTWELMQGLDDDDESLSTGAAKPAVSASPALESSPSEKASTVVKVDVGLVAAEAVDFPAPASPGMTPSSASKAIFGKKASQRPRPKSFTSIRSVEEVDAVIASRCSKTPPPEWDKCSSKAKELRESGDEMEREATSVSQGCCSQVASDTAPPRSEESTTASDERSAWNADNLQRALSFKYILNHSSSENHDQAESLASRDTEAPSDCTSEPERFSTRTIELVDGLSSPSSPDFSAAASLKDWLPHSGPLKQQDDLQTGVRRSLLGAFQDSGTSVIDSPRQRTVPTPLHLPNFKRVRSTINKYVAGDHGESFPENRSNNASPRREAGKFCSEAEKCESPVFDPELLESFEKAMDQLSEEEWNAVRIMEEDAVSPREFLHLVNSLGSSSGSNPVQILRSAIKAADASVAAAAAAAADAGTGNKITEGSMVNYSRSLDGSRNKQNTEERRSPIRLYSRELKKNRGEEERVVLYSTNSQSDAKVLEDCNAVRAVLRSLGASFDERNIFLQPEFEQELKHALEMAVVPTLFLKGRYFVGVDMILQLYRKGMLGSWLKEAQLPVGGVGIERSKAPCLCRGGKFLICPLCKGRRKLIRLGEGVSSCRHCSGTGLIKCPNCSSNS